MSSKDKQTQSSSSGSSKKGTGKKAVKEYAVQNPEAVIKQDLEEMEKQKAALKSRTQEQIMEDQVKRMNERENRRQELIQLQQTNPELYEKAMEDINKKRLRQQQQQEEIERLMRRGIVEMHVRSDQKQKNPNPDIVLSEFQRLQNWDAKSIRRQEEKSRGFMGRRRADFLHSEGNNYRRWYRYVSKQLPHMVTALMKRGKA